MLSSSVRFSNGMRIMGHLFCLRCRFIKLQISGRRTQNETGTLLSFPRDNDCIIGSRGKPCSLLESLCVRSHFFPASFSHSRLAFRPLALFFYVLICSVSLSVPLNILCIPSWCRCSCQMASDPVG